MPKDIKQKKANKLSSFLNNKLDYILIITILFLLALGVIMVLSASAPSSLSKNGSSYTYFIRQFAFAISGIFLMLFISKIDYRKYQKHYWLIYIISVSVLLLVLVPGLGKQLMVQLDG